MSLQIEFAGNPERIRLRDRCLGIFGKYGTSTGSDVR